MWHELVAVVYLKNVKPRYEVSGRRKDGTIKGKRLIRRFFWNVFRGVVNVTALSLACSGGSLFSMCSSETVL
jgi:hypothetical protein